MFSLLQTADYWVTVHSLKSSSDGGILDPDDKLRDVVDDKEQVRKPFREMSREFVCHVTCVSCDCHMTCLLMLSTQDMLARWTIVVLLFMMLPCLEENINMSVSGGIWPRISSVCLSVCPSLSVSLCLFNCHSVSPSTCLCAIL